MESKKVVVIHQIRESMTNLEDTIEHYRPDYLFLISCMHNIRDKPDFARLEVERKNARVLGPNVKHIEYTKLIGIEDAWHHTTMMEVFKILGEIKQECEELAGEDNCEYYVGLSDGTALITVGISFAAVLHGMKTYFTRGRRSYYDEEYVIEVENLNKITEIKNWLESKYNTKENLKYLRAIINLEDCGESSISSAKIADMLDPYTQKAVDNAMNVLLKKGLIEKEKKEDQEVKRNRTFYSTDLGKLIIKLNPE